MLKEYKNKILKIVEAQGYNLDLLDWRASQDTSWIYSTLQEKKFAMRIEFIYPLDNYHGFKYRFTRFSPNFSLTDFMPQNLINFDELSQAIVNWLDNDYKRFREEQDGVDLWEEYKKGNRLLDINKIDFDDTTNFSVDEKKQIRLGINELKTNIPREFLLAAEQQKLLFDRLDYLTEAVDRLRKNEWKSILISSVIQIGFTLALDTEQFERLKYLIGQTLTLVPQILLESILP